MLDPVIIRKIREEERRRRETQQPQIPLYYEPHPRHEDMERPKKQEDEATVGGTVIELEL